MVKNPFRAGQRWEYGNCVYHILKIKWFKVHYTYKHGSEGTEIGNSGPMSDFMAAYRNYKSHWKLLTPNWKKRLSK